MNQPQILGITASASLPDIEPAGRELNLCFRHNKQNLPRKNNNDKYN